MFRGGGVVWVVFIEEEEKRVKREEDGEQPLGFIRNKDAGGYLSIFSLQHHRFSLHHLPRATISVLVFYCEQASSMVEKRENKCRWREACLLFFLSQCCNRSRRRATDKSKRQKQIMFIVQRAQVFMVRLLG
jgi:hypothetical protein